MKKTLINIALGGSIMLSVAFFGAHKADAQTIDLSQFRALVQLLIAIGAIPADKADIARNFVGITSSTPVVTATSTPIFISGSNVQSNTPASVEPTLGSVEDNYDFEPTVSIDGNNQWIISVPSEATNVTLDYYSKDAVTGHTGAAQGKDIKISGGNLVRTFGLSYNKTHYWTIKATVNGKQYSKSGQFFWPEN